ncbi:MAG: hypothetical protein A2287_03395 [Candidatus Melainabacteria bacterium RIFOXYA12_FULL_32_12]|nr:MAG: hypothetical protein A2287_03395 [Candidatus Melainabacteria bacterium RIFOXYA12_FULL_32_12]
MQPGFTVKEQKKDCYAPNLYENGMEIYYLGRDIRELGIEKKDQKLIEKGEDQMKHGLTIMNFALGNHQSIIDKNLL